MTAFHALSVGEASAELKTVEKDGLSVAEAQARLKQYGPNMLSEEESVHWLQILLRQFTNFLILILALAAVLSYFLGDIVDAVAILAIVVLNGLLGFAQEWKAETALQSLKKMLKPHCRVIRGGLMQDIDAASLVPGDIVVLNSGDSVPADLRLLDAVNLKADEAALTGESVPVDKDTKAVDKDAHITARTCMAWMGTHIVNGSGQGIVTGTGSNTEFGRIAGLTGKIQETQTRLQRQLAVLARQLTILIMVVIAAVMFIGWVGGKPPFQMLMAGIALAVSAIPEGLPAVVTITLALGVRIMARHKALLRHLQTAETLGATSVICTDKTGTLTRNEMTIQKLWLGSGVVSISGVGYEPAGGFSKEGNSIKPLDDPDLKTLLETGYICNHARIVKTDTGWTALGSPTEAAFVTAAQKAGIEVGKSNIFCEFSFNSTRKRMSVVEECRDSLCVHVKGAPEVLLTRADKILIDGKEQPLDQALREKVEQAYHDLAQEGLRTLALARKKLPPAGDVDEKNAETGLVFLGVAGIIDPPRPEAKTAIEKTCQAGIRVIMITGDSADTALAVARQIGLKAQKAVTGTELEKMSDDDMLALLEQDVIFARTVPEDKFRIVKLLQSQNQLVAMTGDGVNDAPALKQADIGIAMGIRGTDVAKGASDMVLSDDNFASIVSAIEEGRRQYTNIRKFINYLVSHNFGETMAVFANILMGSPLILLPVQILWVNLVTDSIAALSLSVEKAEKNIMKEPPRDPNHPILDKTSLVLLLIFGSYIALATLGLYHFYLTPDSYALANTLAFTAMVVLSNIGVLNFRSFDKPTYIIGWFSNPWLLAAVLSMISLQLAAIYTPLLQEVLNTVPLGWIEWVMILTVAVPMVLFTEIYKMIKFTKSKDAGKYENAG